MSLRNMIMSLATAIARILPNSLKRSLYRNPGLSEIIRSTMNRYVPHGLSEVSISTGIVSTLRMNLDLQSEKDYWLGTYEPELQFAIKDLTKPGQIIFDVGANIGFTSLLFAERTGSTGHVFSFEALPSNITRLEENIALNNFKDWVTIIHAAVQDQSGPVNFLIGPSHGTGKAEGSLGRSNLNYHDHIQVPGVSIDDFVYLSEHDKPDIIKIDIEGGELLALTGMLELLRDCGPILLLELHGLDSTRGCWDLLEKEKYQICEMAPGYSRVPNVTELDWKSYIVAFPNESA